MFNRITCHLCIRKPRADGNDVHPYEDKNESNCHKMPEEDTHLRTGKRNTDYSDPITQQITENDRQSVPGPMRGNYYETEQTEVKRPIPTDDEYPRHPDSDSRTSKKMQHSKIRELEEEIRLLQRELQTVKQERDEALSRQSDSEMEHKIQTLEDQIKELKKEKDDILTRLSEYTSKAVADNNPNIADLGDINRPTKLVERFSELYDNEWTEAFEYLLKTSPTDTRGEAAVKAIKVLLKVLQKIYDLCTTEASSKLKSTVESIYGLTKREKSCGPIKRSLKEFKDERKQNYEAFLPDLNKQIDGMEEIWIHCNRDVSEYTLYITKATEICWLMSIQDPPMELCFSGRNRKEFDGELFRAYTETGKKIAFVVWPAVLLSENGSTLMKGVAQGKTKTKKKESLIKHAKNRKSNAVGSIKDKQISLNNDDESFQKPTIDNSVTIDEPPLGAIVTDKNIEKRKLATAWRTGTPESGEQGDSHDDDNDVVFVKPCYCSQDEVFSEPSHGNRELIIDTIETTDEMSQDLIEEDHHKMNSVDKMMRVPVKQAFPE